MMQTVVSVLNADLLAFQEVDSVDALSRVIDPDEYNFYFSDRAKYHQKSRGSNQFTGWAVKKNIEVIDHADFAPLGLPTFLSKGNLRYGSYIEVRRENQPPLHLLSIHLKSGCFETPVRRNNSCKKLERQIDALSVWIKTRQKLGHEFVIAGDFNHYMNTSNEWVWETLQKEAGKGNLINLSEHTIAKCKARRFNYRTKRWEQVVYDKLIDHIIASPGVLSSDIIPLAKQFRYSYHSVANYRLSDHCPVYVGL
ncbi:endonuclease/exonuclease/phosphatase family protein [Enterovibrio coralii]|uniref:Endonuclease/exonuclease/phosphatase domain-containing protein n=1 Tax=Enterovibrio coralii TaxID=294935 RepID=A0A135ICD8_9GAMM|nr:endonuclease/exonuclease/phosphatase family protein [Enterovibrio coralii]KXF83123.1 hypothetical protein ATN88_05275 [Enterovibrio coralii]